MDGKVRPRIRDSVTGVRRDACGTEEDNAASAAVVADDATSATADAVDLVVTDVADQPMQRPPVLPSSQLQRTDAANLHGTVQTVAQAPPLPPPPPSLSRLAPRSARLSGVILRRAASFHKKVLKVSALQSMFAEPQLKLGTFKSKDVASLMALVRVATLVGPVLQIGWTLWIEPDIPAPVEPRAFQISIGDAAEATIQMQVIATAWLFMRRALSQNKKRQGMQTAMATVVAFAATTSVLTFTADFFKSSRAHSDHGHKLLSFANALLATSIYLTIGYLTDHFAETILSSKEAFQHTKQQRLLDRSRRFAFVLNTSCGLYLAVRLALTWRSDVVLDFLPMTNIITPLRVLHREHKQLPQKSHVVLDSLVISVGDALLLILAYTKCFFTHQLFNHIFLIDFARVYTEYRVFVVNFRNTITVITLCGHVASWTVPFSHTIDPVQLAQPQLDIQSTGSVQMQLGFRFSLALWLVSAAYCALPADSGRGEGWCLVRRTPEPKSLKPTKQMNQRIKYFLYESDVHVKAGYRNLARAGHVDASRFILENQVEAFNFAQLVYARGNTRYDQELDALQKLVGDPDFSIVEVVHNAETDTHCLILESDTKIVVAFRGTSSKKNAQTDLQSSMVVHTGAKQVDLAKLTGRGSRSKHVESEIRTIWHRLLCKRNDPRVHSGFYSAYLSVADTVLAKISTLHHSGDDRVVMVTGHSLGGALAALCSFDIVAKLRVSNVTCTTFGCPRIGNHAFQKRFAHVVPATFAFVNASDLVTKLPPKTPKAQSYTSVGTTVLINAFGNLVIEPNGLELEMMHRGYSPKAHTMRAYHLSLLLWCLRAHDTKYHPRFWRQSLAFLQAEYGHLHEVRDYLKQSIVVGSHLQASNLHLTFKAAGDGSVSRAQLRRVVCRLEAALRQERDDHEDDAIILSVHSVIVSRISQWFHRTTAPCEWFATNDAIRLLVAQLGLESDAAAVDLGQTLTVHGLLKPETVVFSRNSRFFFPVLDEDDDEDDDGDDSDEAEQVKPNGDGRGVAN